MLSATARDDDDDPLQYSYQLTGNGVDLSSGWVSGQWQVPPHSIDPGLSYSWTVTVRDGRGGQPPYLGPPGRPALLTAKRLVAMSTGAGYWQVASDGGVFSYGSAPFYGSLPGLGIHVSNIIGMARTPDDRGYWLVGSDGGVFAFGDAPYLGSLPDLGIHVSKIVGIPPPGRQGYWLVGRTAACSPSATPSSRIPRRQALNAPIVGIAPTRRQGLLARRRRTAASSATATPSSAAPRRRELGTPVIGIARPPTGSGYWLAGANGGVFAFGDAPFEARWAASRSTADRRDHPSTTVSATALDGGDGGVFTFGDAPSTDRTR